MAKLSETMRRYATRDSYEPLLPPSPKEILAWAERVEALERLPEPIESLRDSLKKDETAGTEQQKAFIRGGIWACDKLLAAWEGGSGDG